MKRTRVGVVRVLLVTLLILAASGSDAAQRVFSSDRVATHVNVRADPDVPARLRYCQPS